MAQEADYYVQNGAYSFPHDYQELTEDGSESSSETGSKTDLEPDCLEAEVLGSGSGSPESIRDRLNGEVGYRFPKEEFTVDEVAAIMMVSPSIVNRYVRDRLPELYFWLEDSVFFRTGKRNKRIFTQTGLIALMHMQRLTGKYYPEIEAGEVVEIGGTPQAGENTEPMDYDSYKSQVHAMFDFSNVQIPEDEDYDDEVIGALVPTFGGADRSQQVSDIAFIDQIVSDALAFQDAESAHIAQMGAADGARDAAAYLRGYATEVTRAITHGREQVRNAVIRNVSQQEQQKKRNQGGRGNAKG